MRTSFKPLLAMTTADLMNQDVITIPQEMSLKAAAHLLFQNSIGGAPVVDGNGRCIGMLCATDFIHWAEEGAKGAEDSLLPACAYQTKGHMSTGEEAVICTLAEERCPLQEMRRTTDGRHVPVCVQPSGLLSDWQMVAEALPVSAVSRYMSVNIVTAQPLTPLPELARKMIESHTQRVVVLDSQRRPIGIVSSTDLLSALAYADKQ